MAYIEKATGRNTTLPVHEKGIRLLRWTIPGVTHMTPRLWEALCERAPVWTMYTVADALKRNRPILGIPFTLQDGVLDLAE